MSVQVHTHIRKLESHPTTSKELTPEQISFAARVTAAINAQLAVHEAKVAASKKPLITTESEVFHMGDDDGGHDPLFRERRNLVEPKLDAALYAEAELQRQAYDPKLKLPLLSKSEKERQRRKTEQYHAEQREQGKDVPKEKLTAKEMKQAQREQQRQMEEQKQERDKMVDDYQASLKGQQKQLADLQREKLMKLHMKWNADDNVVDHQHRRRQRVAMLDQMVRYRSSWWHARALEFYRVGVPRVNRAGQQIPVMDPATKKPLLDPETGSMIPDRHAPGQKMFMEIFLPPESLYEFSVEFNPSMDTRVYTEEQAQELLHAHEAIALDPKWTPRERADREQAEVLLRNLVRDITACDPETQFVYKLTVACNSLVPNGKPGTPNGPTDLYGTGMCSYDEEQNMGRIAALGPLKRPHKICFGCDSYVLVADDLLKRCNRCEDDTKVFCCAPCKNIHVRKAHENTLAAKKHAKRQRERANAKKRKAELKLAYEQALAKEAKAQAEEQEEQKEAVV